MSIVQDDSTASSGTVMPAVRRGTIIEPIVVLFRGHYGIAAVATALALFLAGLLIAAAIDFDKQYRESRQVYLGVVSVVLAMVSIAWATRRLPAVMENVRPIFLVSTDRFRSEVERFEVWAFNWPLQIGGTLMLWAFSCFDIYRRASTNELHAFKGPWTEPQNLLVKSLILMLYDLVCVALLVVSVIGVVCYISFVTNIRRLPLVPHLAIARTKLGSLTDFAVATGLAWSVGVSLVVLLYDLKFEPNQIVTVLVFTALGLGIFLLPELAIHTALDRVRHDVLNEAIRRLKTPASADGADWRTLVDRTDAASSDGFDRVVQEAINTPTWTYDLVNVSTVLGTWLLPLLPLAANSLVK